MKKYLPTLVLTALIIPSVAFASWWNPFTWNIFSLPQPNPQVQIISTTTSSDQILTDSSTSTATTTISIATSTEVTVATTSIPNINISVKKVTPPVVVKIQQPTQPRIASIKTPTPPVQTQTSVVSNSSAGESKVCPDGFTCTLTTPSPATVTCPEGYTCTTNPNAQQLGNCPAGYDCTPTGENKTVVDTATINVLVTASNTKIAQYKQSLIDDSNFVTQISSEMSQFPNDSTVQQTGQQLLDDMSAHDYLANELVGVYVNIENTITPYTTSNSTLYFEVIDPMVSEVLSYSNQYNTGQAQITQAMKDFLNAQANALNSKAVQLQYQINQAGTQQQAASQAQIDAVNASAAKYNELRSAASSNGVTESVFNAQLNAAGLGGGQVNCTSIPNSGMGGYYTTCNY